MSIGEEQNRDPDVFFLAVTREEMNVINELLKLVENRKFPFLPYGFITFKQKIEMAHQDGCYIHNVVRGIFKINPVKTITICPDCDPITFINLVKHNHECIRAPTKFGIPMTDAGSVDEEK